MNKSSLYNINFKIQWAGVFLVLLGLLVLLAIDKFGEFNPEHRILTVFILLISYPVYRAYNTYSLRQGFWGGCVRVSAAWLTLLAVLAIIGFITKSSATYSREVFFTWTIIGLLTQIALLPAQRIISSSVIRKFSNQGRVIIIGSGQLVSQVVDRVLQLDTEQLLGVVTLDSTGDSTPIGTSKAPCLGLISDLPKIVANLKVSKAYIAMDNSKVVEIKNLYVDLLDKIIDIVWVPDLSDMILFNHSIDDLLGLPIIRLTDSPLTNNQFMTLVKTLVDRLVSLILIVVLLPIFIIVAILIKQESIGPVIYKQKRHGLNGRIFTLYKFRSMFVSDEQFRQATKSDSRVTAVGRIIRKTSIDELPQLINVLKGDMSLVGPRPHPIELNDYYEKKIQAYMARHKIKPGLTGLAQIHGFRGETDSFEKMKRRFEYDLEYINSWSLILDLRILLKTPMTLLSHNAY